MYLLPLETRAWVTTMLIVEKGRAVEETMLMTDIFTPIWFDFNMSSLIFMTDSNLHLYKKLSLLHSWNTSFSASVGM